MKYIAEVRTLVTGMDLYIHLVFSLVLLIQAALGIYIQDRDDSTSTLIKKQFSFPVMRHYMPHGKHLKSKRLLRKLGKDFNSEWMSTEIPKISNYVPDTFPLYGNKIEDSLAKLRLDQLVKMHAVDMGLSNQTQEIIKTFMQRMSTCHTNFEWEELGNLFWPRYVKSGICVSSGSCSWPSGMHCQASENKTLRLLHWRCIRRKQTKTKVIGKTNKDNRTKEIKRKTRRNIRSTSGVIGKKLKCRWKKIPYEVTAKCGCSC
ncbi:noggin-2-like isoform X2 [Mercenaria mercenaria]|uniref:noggin-2-like isoform X2 n=1 Tax=Mercenaria mercenaria TaxID=6596 RepID=UPI00234F4C63|nr:noggin-2-like isoform X2 [Mercenaria mercenaria]